MVLIGTAGARRTTAGTAAAEQLMTSTVGQLARTAQA